MSEPHVIGGLRRKQSELGGVVNQLEQRLVKHRADLAHLDATTQLFDPAIRPQEIQQQAIVGPARIIDALRIDDTGADENA